MVYAGGSALSGLPSIKYINAVGDIALFIAAALLLY